MSVLAELREALVIDPEGLVLDDDPKWLYVNSKHLSSSEAEALVAAMKKTMKLPIRVDGVILTHPEEDYHIGVWFKSAVGGRGISFSHDSQYLTEILRESDASTFVLDKPKADDTSEHRAFDDYARTIVSF